MNEASENPVFFLRALSGIYISIFRLRIVFFFIGRNKRKAQIVLKLSPVRDLYTMRFSPAAWFGKWPARQGPHHSRSRTDCSLAPLTGRRSRMTVFFCAASRVWGFNRHKTTKTLLIVCLGQTPCSAGLKSKFRPTHYMRAETYVAVVCLGGLFFKCVVALKSLQTRG